MLGNCLRARFVTVTVMVSTLSTTRGFHTTWTTTVKLTRDLIQDENCSLYLLYDLPRHVFVDQYELANYRGSYTFHLSGTKDMELPVTALVFTSSNLLLNVSLESEIGSEDLMVSVQVPLHMRYGQPGLFDYHEERIPSPVAYLACPGSCAYRKRVPCQISNVLYSAATPISQPSASVPSQISSLFNQRSVTVLSSPSEAESHAILRIPVGRSDHLAIVETGTTCVVIFAFVLILRTSLRVAMRLAHKGHSDIHSKRD